MNNVINTEYRPLNFMNLCVNVYNIHIYEYIYIYIYTYEKTSPHSTAFIFLVNRIGFMVLPMMCLLLYNINHFFE